MKARIRLMALCLISSINGVSLAAEPHYAATFQEAKRSVWKIYADHMVDQYCGCHIGRDRKIDLADCGYEPRKNGKRALRPEIEHTMPAESIGRQHACWRQGGREHCNQTDREFSNAHNDLHNLMPVIGEVNGDRSNFRYNEIPTGYGQYGACHFKVDFPGRSAEPPPSMKGDLARIAFYMRDQHGIKLSRQQEQLYTAWSKMDPVDSWELERDRRITRIQGNSNPYVSGGRAVVPNGLPGVKGLQLTDRKVETKADACGAPKSCKQISSCDEAIHEIKVCGNTRVDGNHDGVPCEALCG